jgi:hypothetical protein
VRSIFGCHILVLFTLRYLWFKCALLFNSQFFISNQFLFFCRSAIIVMPFVGRQRWCNLFRNRINLRFKSAFTVDFLRRLILFQQLALIVSMVKPLDFVDFRLRASHWVRSTDNFTIEVYLGLEFEFRFICIFASQIFSFFSLAGQVFLLPLFEILEGPLKDFNITSYLFAIWTNIWLKRA